MSRWLDEPDAEGWWWVEMPDGDLVVAEVRHDGDNGLHCHRSGGRRYLRIPTPAPPPPPTKDCRRVVYYEVLARAEAAAATWWGPTDAEYYDADDIDEAIEAVLDEWADDDLYDHLMKPGAYDRLRIVGMRPADVAGVLDAEGHLHDALETLYQEYGDPDALEPELTPTPAMRAAADHFARTIEREYTPWVCEEAIRVLVDVRRWVLRHRRHWAEELLGRLDPDRRERLAGVLALTKEPEEC